MIILPNMSCVFDDIVTGLNDAYVRSTVTSPNDHEMTGYVHTLATGNAIFITEDCIPYYITVDYLEHYHLQTGDRIRARVGYEYSYNNYVVTDIAQVTKIAYDDITTVKNNQTFELNGNPIEVGTTALFTLQAQDNYFQRLAELYQQLPADTVPIVLSFDGRAEKLTDYPQVYLTKPDQSARDKLTICLLAFFHAKELASRGQQVVVLIDSLDKMFTVFNDCMQQMGVIKPEYISSAAITDLINLLHSSGCLSSGGSLTILGLHRPGISQPQIAITDRFRQTIDQLY